MNNNASYHQNKYLPINNESYDKIVPNTVQVHNRITL